jgi:hypothetical protein
MKWRHPFLLRSGTHVESLWSDKWSYFLFLKGDRSYDHPSQRQTDPLTVHSYNVEPSYSKFSSQCSCELNLDIVRWPELMGRGTKSSAWHKLTRSLLSCWVLHKYILHDGLTTNIIMSYLKGRNVVSRLPPTQWKHNKRGNVSPCLITRIFKQVLIICCAGYLNWTDLILVYPGKG